MSEANDFIIEKYYARLKSPISEFDCGLKCAPYNERGAPFCCDTRHAVPTAYQAEWEYLQENTTMWRLWQSGDALEMALLQKQTPIGQVLIECQGYLRCQRQFRAITCRAFPFFPYIDKAGNFIGLAYYWEYEDRCWVINHLEAVTLHFKQEFILLYDDLFHSQPGEYDNFRYHSMMLRRVFGRRRRLVPLLHRDGFPYLVSPRTGIMQPVEVESLQKYGPYLIAETLPFPDEL